MGIILGPDRPKRWQDEPKRAIRSFKEPKSCIFKNLKKTFSFLVFLDPEASQENLKRSKKAPKRHPKRHPKVVQKLVKKLSKSKPKNEQKKTISYLKKIALTGPWGFIKTVMGLYKNAYFEDV